MKSLEPTTVTVWPYRPAGHTPCTSTRVQSRVPLQQKHVNSSYDVGKSYAPKVSMYKALSYPSTCSTCFFRLALPPQTKSVLFASALACPDLRDGLSPAVCSSVIDRSRVEKRYRSLHGKS